jgi:hypothetical protein
MVFLRKTTESIRRERSQVTKPYIDPTTGQWVGERETRSADGEITRETEWFDTEAEARQFSRTAEHRSSGGPSD